MTATYITDYLRTPIGKFKGALSSVRADDLAADCIVKLLKRSSQIKAEQIEDVVFGCANQAGEDNRNVARMAALLAGLPVSVPGLTVNRLCASGLAAVASVAGSISRGEGDLFVAGGVEQMTRAPFVMAKAEAAFPSKLEVFDTSLGWRLINPRMKTNFGVHSMGETAENLCEQYGISRQQQDEFACWSQTKAEKARKAGRLAQEIFAVEVVSAGKETKTFADDEFIRADTTMDKLGALKPAFRFDGKGSVTAGNSSGLNDGAAALLLASEVGIKSHGLKPRARVLAYAVAGVEPRVMGIGPVFAIRKVLDRAKLKLADMNLIEINEAFAAQCLACFKELGLTMNDARINPNGGAIALGHPLGMSGARLVGTAMLELELRQERYALVSLCVGVGQGAAMIIERVSDG